MKIKKIFSNIKKILSKPWRWFLGLGECLNWAFLYLCIGPVAFCLVILTIIRGIIGKDFKLLSLFKKWMVWLYLHSASETTCAHTGKVYPGHCLHFRDYFPVNENPVRKK
jgi:hypothetical protein